MINMPTQFLKGSHSHLISRCQKVIVSYMTIIASGEFCLWGSSSEGWRNITCNLAHTRVIINVEVVKELFGPAEKGICFFGREELRNNQISVLKLALACPIDIGTQTRLPVSMKLGYLFSKNIYRFQTVRTLSIWAWVKYSSILVMWWW